MSCHVPFDGESSLDVRVLGYFRLNKNIFHKGHYLIKLEEL